MTSIRPFHTEARDNTLRIWDQAAERLPSSRMRRESKGTRPYNTAGTENRHDRPQAAGRGQGPERLLVIVPAVAVLQSHHQWLPLARLIRSQLDIPAPQ